MKFTSATSSLPVPRSQRLKVLFAGLATCWLATGSVQASGSLVSPPPTTISIDHSALWLESTPPTILVIVDSRADLTTQMQQHAANGLRLAAFESWQEQGSQRLAGLFRASSGARNLYFDLDAADFEARRLQQAAQGESLLDVEVEIVQGERRYSGLWGTGRSSEIVLDNLAAAAFEANVLGHSETHVLALFETWVDNGEVRAYGILRPADIDDVVLMDMTQTEFFTALTYQGGIFYQLVDIDIASSGHYSARWVKNVPKLSDWLGVFYNEVELESANAMLAAGFGNSGISLGEAFVVPTGIPLPLRDLEVTVNSVSGPIIQAKPITDAGTPGPPR